jgi:hypothetical protein
MNETDGPVEMPFHLLDADRILGGNNTLTMADVRKPVQVPEKATKLWENLQKRSAGAEALRDIEHNKAVPAVKDGESYGPVYIPYHDYRILYAERRQ